MSELEINSHIINNSETFRILSNYEDITKTFIAFFLNTKERLDGYGVTNGIPLMLQSKIVYEILANIKRQGNNLRYITEINSANLEICKQMMKYVELRHLDNIKGGLMINDTECILMIKSKDNEFSTPTPSVQLYNTSSTFVKQQQRAFDIIWDRAIPAFLKIKQIEEGYQQTDDDKNQDINNEFTHVVADGLRNPLQSIMGFSKLLISKKMNADNYKKYLHVIDNNSQILVRRIDEIIYLMEMEDKTFTLYKEKFDLKELITEIASSIPHKGNYLPKSKYHIYSEFGDIKVIINADKRKIGTVIENLLINAAEFSEGKDVDVNINRDTSNDGDLTANDERYITLSVADRGNGIDKSIFPNLFLNFVTTSSKGLGLGLYISKNIIEAHGGSIWAKNSSNEGKGAIFSFKIPLV